MIDVLRRWWPVGVVAFVGLILGLSVLAAFRQGGSATSASAGDGGPIAQWDFASRIGNRVLDSAGGHDGTVHHASWTTSSKYFSFSVLLQLDGERTYMEIPASQAPTLDGAFTVAAWIRSASHSQRQILLFKADPTGSFRSAPVKVYVPWGQGRIGIVFSDGKKRVGFLSDESIRSKQWYHVAVTYDDSHGRIRYYIDGQLAGEDTTSWRPRGELSPFYIGMGRTDEDVFFPFEGKLESIMLFKRTLSTDEVARLYRRENVK
ncbi:MAG: LamG domain-containing protein [Salinibacter sp.]